jgi:hypothetical protein
MTGSADRDELPTAQLSRRPRLTMRGLMVGFLIIAAVVARVLATRSGSPAASAPASRPAAPLTTRAQAPESGQADVTIGAHESVTAIPHSFLGFSTEYWTLPVDEHHISLYKRILSMIHVQGDGRFVLRIGGDSSDHAVWGSGGTPAAAVGLRRHASPGEADGADCQPARTAGDLRPEHVHEHAATWRPVGARG